MIPIDSKEAAGWDELDPDRAAAWDGHYRDSKGVWIAEDKNDAAHDVDAWIAENKMIPTDRKEAWAEYWRVTEAAMVERDPYRIEVASAEYKRVIEAAWAEYERVIATTNPDQPQ